MFSYDAESDVELNLSSGDYVVIRKVYTSWIFFIVIVSFNTILVTKLVFGKKNVQVSNNGWAEGECKGKAGWFPVEYVERRERVLASKVTQVY